ncbi:MAG: electron transfer flavoprotein subunit beta/FixA family protein [Bacteroidales bacterium]|nr:electron transfer flavoprotein subunit beta/FixA family protein [Bacteroidales bacterium]
MKIIVLVKQVPDTTEIKINPVTGTLIRDGVPAIMNPDDKGALELALQLKDKFGAEITVITMGLPQADLVLREALAMGADNAVLLTDRKLGGADTLATSRALSGALRVLGYDIIVGGRQAIDGDTAQVGPQIAEHLDIPQISYVVGMDYDGKNTYTVKKETEEGYQMLEVDGPCLFTVLASAYKPRYMNVRGIVEAYDKEVKIMDASMIGIDENMLGLKGSPTRVFKSFTKGIKQAGEVFEVSPEEAADLIVARLKEKHII